MIDYSGLFKAMQVRGKTFSDLKAAGVSNKVILKIASGQNIYMEDAKKIADYLNWNIYDLAKKVSDNAVKAIDRTDKFSPKRVAKYDLRGNYLATYSSHTQAAKSVFGCPSAISKCAQGKRKSAYGYIWKYVDV